MLAFSYRNFIRDDYRKFTSLKRFPWRLMRRVPETTMDAAASIGVTSQGRSSALVGRQHQAGRGGAAAAACFFHLRCRLAGGVGLAQVARRVAAFVRVAALAGPG